MGHMQLQLAIGILYWRKETRQILKKHLPWKSAPPKRLRLKTSTGSQLEDLTQTFRTGPIWGLMLHSFKSSTSPKLILLFATVAFLSAKMVSLVCFLCFLSFILTSAISFISFLIPKFLSSTHGRKIQRDEAPKVLAPPTTANLAEWNFLLKVVLSH